MKQQLAQQQYVTTQVGTADRLQLVIMLYDGAISFLGQAREKMVAKDAAAKGLLIGRALDIIAELNASLNFQAGRELATSLFHLYNFMTGHLTKANLNWDLTALDEVLDMLQKLRESWVEVAHRARRGELEENGEAVDASPGVISARCGFNGPKSVCPKRRGPLQVPPVSRLCPIERLAIITVMFWSFDG